MEQGIPAKRPALDSSPCKDRVVEARCPSRIQFRIENGLIEVACHSKKCGAGNGTIVLHYYNDQTYELEKTLKFKNPAVYFERKESE